MPQKIKYIHNCDYCGKEHGITEGTYKKLNNGQQKKSYCSIECKKYGQHTGYDVKCDNCGKMFYRNLFLIKRQIDGNNFCSVKCEFDYKHKQTYEYRTCEICGTTFECYKISNQRFCSNKCNSIWQTTIVGELNPKFTQKKIKCEYCGNKYYVKNYKTINNQTNLCSVDCRVKWFKEIFSITDNTKILDEKLQ